MPGRARFENSNCDLSGEQPEGRRGTRRRSRVTTRAGEDLSVAICKKVYYMFIFITIEVV